MHVSPHPQLSQLCCQICVFHAPPLLHGVSIKKLSTLSLLFSCKSLVGSIVWLPSLFALVTLYFPFPLSLGFKSISPHSIPDRISHKLISEMTLKETLLLTFVRNSTVQFQEDRKGSPELNKRRRIKSIRFSMPKKTDSSKTRSHLHAWFQWSTVKNVRVRQLWRIKEQGRICFLSLSQ